MKATLPGGKLIPINCWIDVPGSDRIKFQSLPDIDDSKNATYESDEGIGRTQPFTVYKSSGFRKVSLGLHFYITDDKDVDMIWKYIRILQSIVYPGPGTTGPFTPPAVCKIGCGKIFKDVNGDHICAVCTSVGVKYPTDVVWDEETYLPYKIDINTSWQVVYAAGDMPGSDKIIQLGN